MKMLSRISLPALALAMALAGCQRPAPEAASAAEKNALPALSLNPAALPSPLAGQDIIQLARLTPELWLAQSKEALLLLDANRVLATQALAGDRLDVRLISPDTAVAVMQDKKGRLLRLDLDLKNATLKPAQALAAADFSVEGFCLQHSRDGLSLFLLGQEGHGEQWLLTDAGPRTIRSLALPPGSEHCTVDDAQALLYVSEPALGLWAYEAAIEGKMQRHAVDLLKPFGGIAQSAGNIVATPQGVLLLDAEAAVARLYQREGRRWKAQADTALRNIKDAEALTLAGNTVLMRDDDSGQWATLTLPAHTAAENKAELPQVHALVQTDPVSHRGDAADDPAIWRHPSQAERSLVLGTNKKEGLLVYDLQGREKQKLAVGRLNNVDLRQDVRLGGQRLDLAAATQRDDNSVLLFRIGANGVVSEAGHIPTPLKNIYGICLYQPDAATLDVIVNDKSGLFIQYRVGMEGPTIVGKEQRRFHTQSQPEGCVADDKNRRLFVGEEDRAIWSLSADAHTEAKLSQVMAAGEKLVADIEGLAIYHGHRQSYLLASSQGNHSYVVMDALPPHSFRGAFRVGLNPKAGIDGTSETDGIDVSSAAFGASFPQGLLVIQDGYKRLPAGPQNFKYVSWADIAALLELAQ